MNYEQALEILNSKNNSKINPSLENVSAMCGCLGNPQTKYLCIQIAGTNGKSSVSRMIARLLKDKGLKVGLYTSPELIRLNERIEIDETVISDEYFANSIDHAYNAALKAGFEGATQFELLTVGAFWLFAEEGVDVAVLETGLGGRWDATSICDAKVCVITGVGLDHTDILGNTLEQIAAEKAAIIKEGSVAILAQNLSCRDVFVNQCVNVNATYLDVDLNLEERLAPAALLMPSYQSKNIAVAFTAALKAFELLNITNDKDPYLFAKKALSTLKIPGRFETLREDPLLIIDAAHNPQSAQTLTEELLRRFDQSSMPALILGILKDKDVRGIIEILCPIFSHIIVSKSGSDRSMEPEKLGKLVEDVCGQAPDICYSLKDALVQLSNTPAIATGSITVAGEVKEIFNDLQS